MSDKTIAPAMRALAWDPSSTPAELERVACWAVDCKDEATMLELLERDDLPAEVDSLLAGVTNARVRTSWILRPGRPVGDIAELVGTESREKVLTAFASTEGLPEVVYTAVLDRARGAKPLMALLEGTHVPGDVRYRAAGMLSRQVGRLTHGQRDALYREMSADTGVLRAILSSTDSVSLAKRALGQWTDDLPREAVEHLLDVTVMGQFRTPLVYLQQGRRIQIRTRILTETLVIIERLVLEDPGLAGRRSEVENAVRVLFTAWSVADSRPHERDGLRTRIDDCFADVRLAGMTASDIRQLILSGDNENFLKAVDVVVPHMSYGNPDAIRRLANSMALDLAASEMATGPVLERLVTSGYPAVRDVLARRPGLSVSDVVTCTLTTASRHHVAEMVANCVDPRAAVSALLAHAEDDARLLLMLSAGNLVDDDQLPEVPAVVLTLMDTRWGRPMPRPLMARCMRWAFTRLGEDPVRWRIFTELAEGFQGTVGELISVVDISS